MVSRLLSTQKHVFEHILFCVGIFMEKLTTEEGFLQALQIPLVRIILPISLIYIYTYIYIYIYIYIHIWDMGYIYKIQKIK